MTRDSICSYRIECKAEGVDAEDLQKYLDKLERFLGIQTVLDKYGWLDNACEALVELARTWLYRNRKETTLSYCKITFYRNLNKTDKVAVIDLLNGTHSASHVLLVRSIVR